MNDWKVRAINIFKFGLIDRDQKFFYALFKIRLVIWCRFIIQIRGNWQNLRIFNNFCQKTRFPLVIFGGIIEILNYDMSLKRTNIRSVASK